MERAVPVKAGKWTGKGLSGAVLKRLAVISMLADHFAVVFLENGLLYQMDHAWAALHVAPAVYGGSGWTFFAGGLRLGRHGVDSGPVSGAGQPGATVSDGAAVRSHDHAA